MKFGLIGDGKIAVKHKQAVNINGGQITKIYDPKYDNNIQLDDKFFEGVDYVIICSPSHLHRKHIQLSLSHNKKIIVEKPIVLPWEPIIDNDNISVVLQYRWIDLPVSANVVRVVMVRNEEYFKTWAGNSSLTGGMFYHLFIHYIDLAIRLKAKFIGAIIPEGRQVRTVDDMDILNIDSNMLYGRMYNDIINHDKGVKPSELFYVHWALERCGWKYGINGSDLVGEVVSINFNRGMDI
jgi:hypothetical protein